MAPKRYPLPKRFSTSLSEKAYKKLRDLNNEYGYGNNYILTILLENFDEITINKSVDEIFDKFKQEYGAPAAGTMKKKG